MFLGYKIEKEDMQERLVFNILQHQDTAYLDAENEKYSQVVAWIPLTDVDSQNGALQIVKGAHKLGKCFTHCIN